MKSILFFQDTGSGFPLVLLHGNGESGEYFAPQIQAFSARYRVIVPDTRGHGLSPRGDGPFTLARFADDLKDLLDDLNIQKAHILGFSDGGNIALLFALKYPQYVEKLILNGANLFPSGVKFSVNVATALAWFGAKAASMFSARAKHRAETILLMLNQPHIDPRRLEALTCPALVMAGDRDMIRETHTRLIHKSIPGSKLVILKGSHFVSAENSGPFNRTVLEFLEI